MGKNLRWPGLKKEVSDICINVFGFIYEVELIWNFSKAMGNGVNAPYNVMEAHNFDIQMEASTTHG